MCVCVSWQLQSDMDRGDGTVKYVLSGEGAGTLFVIDENNGDLHATQSLDREDKAFYTLKATVVNKRTGYKLEPETEFIVKLHDINDNEPKFTKEVYTGSVPERSDIGMCFFFFFLFQLSLIYPHMLPLSPVVNAHHRSKGEEKAL